MILDSYDLTLEILYQDAHYVAVNKPAGLLVHRSPLDRGARVFAVQTVRNQIGQHVYPVHRLDKPTSGVLIFGRSSEAAQRLAHLFQAKQIQKTYVAVVRGYAPKSGVINRALKKPSAHKRKTPPAPKWAKTRYERLATTEVPVAVGRYDTARYTLMMAQPETGRLHQIRRHLAHIAHPIIGDGPHGDRHHNRFFAHHLDCSRLLLAATELRFLHPFTHVPIRITAPVDAAFTAVLERFDWCPHLPTRWLSHPINTPV